MLVCCSSPYCTQHSVSWATGSMDRLRMKVLPWIYPAQTCMLSRIIPLQTHWAIIQLNSFFLRFQHHENRPGCIHCGHIHIVRPAVLRSRRNYLDQLFVETVRWKIEVGIRRSCHNRVDHMWVKVINSSSRGIDFDFFLSCFQLCWPLRCLF